MPTGFRKNRWLPLRQAELAGDRRSSQTGNTLGLQTGKRSPGVTIGMCGKHRDARSPYREQARVSEIIRGSQAAGVKAKASATGSRNQSDLGREHMLHHIRPDAIASPCLHRSRAGWEEGSFRGNEPVRVCHHNGKKESESKYFFGSVFSATHTVPDDGGKEMIFRSPR